MLTEHVGMQMGGTNRQKAAITATHVGTCELAHRESGEIKIVWILFQHHVGGGGEELAKEWATWAGYSEGATQHSL